jgi:hypothetical protein
VGKAKERANARAMVCPPFNKNRMPNFVMVGTARRARLCPPYETARYFGCGTIRIYGFGDFQPCG